MSDTVKVTITLHVSASVASYDLNYGVNDPRTIAGMISADVEDLTNDHFERTGVTADATLAWEAEIR